jgi:Tfp pilus assembly protein PilE
MTYKKGAMFGLDARIALAIFGALSVISGAALYSAIQQSKTIATVTTLQEVAKAYEQYVLDTGQGLPASVHTHDVSAHTLVENVDSLSGWKGPYLPYEKAFTYSLTVNTNGIISIYFIRANNAAFKANGDPQLQECDGSNTCYIWAAVYAGDDLSIYKSIENYIDGADNHDNTIGKFRYQNDTAKRGFLLIGPSIRKTQS